MKKNGGKKRRKTAGDVTMTAMSGAAEAMQMPTSMLTVMDTSQMENLVVTDRLVSHLWAANNKEGGRPLKL